MNYQVEVIQKRQLTHKMYFLQVKLLEPAEMNFKAGQCVAFHVDPKNKRLYSIASTPNKKTILDFLIDISPQGLGSKMVEAMQVRTRFEMSGPFGIFTFPETDKDILLIATGSGLAPYISMIPDPSVQANQLELLFGVREETDMFCVEDLQCYATQNENFNYEVTLTKPSANWAGLTGRVTQHLQRRSPEEFVNKLIYICGGTPMIKDVRAILLEKGVDRKDIKVEVFG